LLLFGIILAATSVAAVRRRWLGALVPVGIGAIAALSLVPYARVFAHRAAWNALGEGPFTLTDLTDRAWEVAMSSGQIILTCGFALLAMGLAAALYSVARPGRASVNGPRRDVAIYAVAAAIAGAVALMAFYLKLRYTTQPWYYVGVLSFVVVCAEVAAASVAGRMVRVSLVLLAIVVLAVGFSPARRALHGRHTNIDAIATRLNAGAGSADLVIANPWLLGVVLSHYYKGAAPLVTVPPLDDFSVHRYDLVKAAMMTGDPLEPLFARIKRTLETGHRVWFVGEITFDPAHAPGRMPPPPLPGSAWNVGPYQEGWGEQAGYFIGTHALDRRPVTTVAGGRYENQRLTIFTGWK
jgi:hypothetical protein